MASKTTELVLRMAIRQEGKMNYSPAIYRRVVADNTISSFDFYEELEKYGRLTYDIQECNNFEEFDENRLSFTIDERGRQYIKELDKKKLLFFLPHLLLKCSGDALIYFFIILLIPCIYEIDPQVPCSWKDGIINGILAIPLFINHLFNTDILYFAINHTDSYTFFYWAALLCIGIPLLIQRLYKLWNVIKDDWVFNKYTEFYAT